MQEIKIQEDNTKEKWESELGITITDDDWEEACKRIFKTTQTKFWKEFAWKVNMKIILTLKTLSKYRPTGKAECWRKCTEPEPPTHFLLMSYIEKILGGSSSKNKKYV